MFLVVDPGLAALGAGVARRLRGEGAIVVPDISGDEHDVLAAQANAFGADVCIAIGTGTEPGARCAYFANQTFRSEAGSASRTASPALRSVLPRVDEPTGRTYRLLRETRMAAVMCELFSRDEPTRRHCLASSGPELARALAAGVRKGIEEPIEVA